MRLRVLTLNVWALPLGLARHRRARMRAIGERFADLDADLVACQEVWTEDARTQLVAAGRDAGYEHVWHRRATRGGSGLLVLSRRPILSAAFTRFTLAGLPQRVHHADYYGGKGFVVLDIALGESPIHFVCTHLQAGYGPADEPDEYRGLRVAQTIEIAAALSQLEGPVLALGDWNFTENDPEYTILAGLSGLRDGAAVLDARAPTVLADHPYRSERAPAERIDLVWARDGAARSADFVSLRRVLDEPLEIEGEPAAYSDHAGLLADLLIEPIARAPAPRPIPEPSALNLAAEWLTRGEQVSLSRRAGERRLAVAALSTAGLAGAGAYRSRRGFARTALALLALLAVASGAGLAWLSERFVPHELAGYQHVRATLDALRGDSS